MEFRNHKAQAFRAGGPELIEQSLLVAVQNSGSKVPLEFSLRRIFMRVLKERIGDVALLYFE